jgi:hypothetical protein
VPEIIDVLDQREPGSHRESLDSGVHEEPDAPLPQQQHDDGRLERLLRGGRHVANEQRQVHTGEIDQPRVNRQARERHAGARANRAEHRADPHELVAVHQLQQHEEQQDGDERDDDVHRRILSESISSRCGAKPRSSATAAPNDSVMSWFESTLNRMSN